MSEPSGKRPPMQPCPPAPCGGSGQSAQISQPPRDRWRAALRAVLAAQATRPPDRRAQ